MESIRQSATPDDEPVAEPTTYWLTHVLPRGLGRSVAVAALIAGGLYVGGLLVAWYAGVMTWYIKISYFYLFALGIFFEVLLLANWSGRYPKLWESLNTPPAGSETPTFAVSDETYDDVVSRGLRRLYRLDIPFVLFVVYHLVVYLFMFEDGGGLLSTLRLVNLTVVHLFGVFIVYLTVCHILLLKDVFTLPITDVETATERVEAVVDSSVVLTVQWLLALAVQSVYVFGLAEVLSSLLGNLVEDTETDTVFATTLSEILKSVDVAELLLLVGLLAVGLFAFVATLFLVHTALAAAKRREMHEISREYDRFYDLWKTEAEPEDRLSVGIDILEGRRESTSAVRTWPYNATMLLRLGVAAQLPVVSFVASVLLGG